MDATLGTHFVYIILAIVVVAPFVSHFLFKIFGL